MATIDSEYELKAKGTGSYANTSITLYLVYKAQPNSAKVRLNSLLKLRGLKRREEKVSE